MGFNFKVDKKQLIRSQPINSATGSIAATALTPDAVFEEANNQKRMSMTLEIKGIETSDLELALNEALRLVTEGYTSGFDKNETGSYKFLIDFN